MCDNGFDQLNQNSNETDINWFKYLVQIDLNQTKLNIMVISLDIEFVIYKSNESDPNQCSTFGYF